MALDKNLFTLNLEPSKIEPTALDLVDPSGTVHYRKRWVQNDAGTYLFSLSEPLSESILATASAPAATSKEKVIELHNPSVVVPLAFKGTLTFKWGFTWEEHDFEWKREACYMIRKPDPPVLVAVTKEPAGKIKTSTVQILDYNLNRFDIEDRKGLEIVLLTSLLTFADNSEQLRAKPIEGVSSSAASTPQAPVVPPPPPKPEGWQEDQIAILQAKEQQDVNEVVIGEAGTLDEYVKHCVSLLNDDTLLFITLRSLNPACVSKVVQVAEATKRTRYKSSGYDDDEELHQYVDMSFPEGGKGKGKSKGPRVINLDDRPPASGPSAPTTTYQPPNTLTIHLSKIAMPELEPKKSTKSKNLSPTPSPNTGPPSRHLQAASEPESLKSTQSDKRDRRKSSAAGSATLAKPPPQASAPPSNGFRAKLSAFTSRSSSRSSSPPPPGRASSSPQPPSAQAQWQSSPPQPHPSHSHSHSQSYPRPGNPPMRPSQHQQTPSYPQAHAPPPHMHHAQSYPPPGPGPQSAVRPRPRSAIYPPQPNQPGQTAPYMGPGQGLLNAPPPGNPAYAFYPSFGGGPAPPPPQRASGKFFGGSR